MLAVGVFATRVSAVKLLGEYCIANGISDLAETYYPLAAVARRVRGRDRPIARRTDGVSIAKAIYRRGTGDPSHR